jgi:hypothetical protein
MPESRQCACDKLHRATRGITPEQAPLESIGRTQGGLVGERRNSLDGDGRDVELA